MVHLRLLPKFIHSDDVRFFDVIVSSENTLDAICVLIRHAMALDVTTNMNVWLRNEAHPPPPLQPLKFPQHYISLFKHDTPNMSKLLHARLREPDLDAFSNIVFPRTRTMPSHPLNLFMYVELLDNSPPYAMPSTATLVNTHSDSDSDADDDNDNDFQVRFY